MKHVGTNTIETTRLTLRKLELTDADMMFRNTDIERIDSFSSVENPASRKVMEKVGMHYEGFYGITIKHETDFMTVLYTESYEMNGICPFGRVTNKNL